MYTWPLHLPHSGRVWPCKLWLKSLFCELSFPSGSFFFCFFMVIYCKSNLFIYLFFLGIWLHFKSKFFAPVLLRYNPLVLLHFIFSFAFPCPVFTIKTGLEKLFHHSLHLNIQKVSFNIINLPGRKDSLGKAENFWMLFQLICHLLFGWKTVSSICLLQNSLRKSFDEGKCHW